MVKVLKKKYLLLTAVLCFSMMMFAGCGNNKDDKDANATGSPAAEESMSPDANDSSTDNPDRDGENALDEAGDATRDAVDDAGDAVRDAVDDAGNAMDNATDNGNGTVDDTAGEKDNATDTNNSETSGKNR